MSLFEPDHSVFRNRDLLKTEYTPDEIVGRDEEIDQLAAALQPVINGEYPDNIFIYGKAGVGKTAVTKHLLEDLSDSAEHYDIDLTVVMFNCDGLSTSYQAAIRLLNRLRPAEEEISETGHPGAKIYRLLWQELNSIGGAVLLVLDEIDHIDDDEFLYQTTRADSNGNIDNIKLGLIGISNDSTFREKLGSKVQSSLCETTVLFPPYNADELGSVLEQRAEKAFHEDALDESIIGLCAAHGRQAGGDARHALNLLRKAGDIARTEGADNVSEQHVERAEEQINARESMDIMRGLTQHGKLTLYALTTLEAEGETPAPSMRVYERYEELCKFAATDPNTSRRLRMFLSDFDTLSITRGEKNHGGHGEGTQTLHELQEDTATVIDALQEFISQVGAHTSIEQHLPDSGTTFETVTTDEA
jgi:cell division control protein 6